MHVGRGKTEVVAIVVVFGRSAERLERLLLLLRESIAARTDTS